jgi:hypothetical protein
VTESNPYLAKVLRTKTHNLVQVNTKMNRLVFLFRFLYRVGIISDYYHEVINSARLTEIRVPNEG